MVTVIISQTGVRRNRVRYITTYASAGGRAGSHRIERELEQLGREIDRYTEAIGKSNGTFDSLLVALRAREEQRARLRRELETFRAEPAIDPRWLEATLRERLQTARHALLARDVSKTRPLLRQLLGGSRMPLAVRGRFYHITAQVGFDELLGGFRPGVGSYVAVVSRRGGAMVTPAGFDTFGLVESHGLVLVD